MQQRLGRCCTLRKYAIGLELEDPGFDHSVLGEFRARVTEQDGAADRLLQVMLDRLREAGLPKPKGGSTPTPHMCWPRCRPSAAWSWSERRCEQPWRSWPRLPPSG